jgi:hypothetical protein
MAETDKQSRRSYHNVQIYRLKSVGPAVYLMCQTVPLTRNHQKKEALS